MTVKRWVLLSVVVFVAVGGAYYFFGSADSSNFTGRIFNSPARLNVPGGEETPPAEGAAAETPPAEGGAAQLPGFFNNGNSPAVVDGGETPAADAPAETPPAEGGAAQLPGFFNGALAPAVVDGGGANQGAGAQQAEAQAADAPLAGQTINLGNLSPRFPNAQNAAEPAAETGPIIHAAVAPVAIQSGSRQIPADEVLTEVLRVRITPVQSTTLSSVRLSLDTTVPEPQLLGDRMQVQLFWQEQNAAEATPLIAEPVNSNNTYRQFDFTNLNRQLTVGLNQAQEQKYFDLIAKVKIIPLGIADLGVARSVRNFKFKIADDGDIRFLAGPNNRINGFTWSDALAGNLMTIDDSIQFSADAFLPPVDGVHTHKVYAPAADQPADLTLNAESDELKEVLRININPSSDTTLKSVAVVPMPDAVENANQLLNFNRLRVQLFLGEHGSNVLREISQIQDISGNSGFVFQDVNQQLNIPARQGRDPNTDVTFDLVVKAKVLPLPAGAATDDKKFKLSVNIPMGIIFDPIYRPAFAGNGQLASGNLATDQNGATIGIVSNQIIVDDSAAEAAPAGGAEGQGAGAGGRVAIDFPFVDLCSDIDGNQLGIPDDRERGENNTCPLTQVDPPAQDPPAQDPPAQDPPAQDPPAQDPPVQDPPPAAPVDRCSNLAGMQEAVPVGLSRDANGICNDAPLPSGGGLPDLPPLQGPQCANLGMYTYSGPDRPNLTNGGCIPCESNLYIATNGSCTIAPVVAANQPQTSSSLANGQTTTSQVHSAAYDGPQTYAPNTNGASLEYSQRLIRAPERGSTGPAANLYVLLAGLSPAMVALYRKVKK